MIKIVQAVAIGVLPLSLSVVAQPAASAESEVQVLEEVVVTARKREESLQDVGMSLSALSGEDLRVRFDSDLQTLQNMSPNLIINDLQQGPGSPAAISIRGIGTTDVEKNFDRGCRGRRCLHWRQLRGHAQGNRPRERRGASGSPGHAFRP